MKRHSHRRSDPTCPSRRSRKLRRCSRPSCFADPIAARARFTRIYLYLVGRFYRRYYRAAVAFAERRGLSYADAEDAVQQWFVAACAAAPRFDRGCKLAPWLWGILRNIVFDALRRRQRWVPLDLLEDEVSASEVETHSPVSVQRFRAMLDRLPEEEVRLLLWFEESHQTLHELALQLGLTYTALTTRLCRARMVLREILRQSGCHSLEDVEDLGEWLLNSPVPLTSALPALPSPRPSCMRGQIIL